MFELQGPWDASEKPNLIIDSTARRHNLSLTCDHLPVRVSHLVHLQHCFKLHWLSSWKNRYWWLNNVLVVRWSFALRVNKYYDNTERRTESHFSLRTGNQECEVTPLVITLNCFANTMSTWMKNRNWWWKTTHKSWEGDPKRHAWTSITGIHLLLFLLSTFRLVKIGELRLKVNSH